MTKITQQLLARGFIKVLTKEEKEEKKNKKKETKK